MKKRDRVAEYLVALMVLYAFLDYILPESVFEVPKKDLVFGILITVSVLFVFGLSEVIQDLEDELKDKGDESTTNL